MYVKCGLLFHSWLETCLSSRLHGPSLLRYAGFRCNFTLNFPLFWLTAAAVDRSEFGALQDQFLSHSVVSVCICAGGESCVITQRLVVRCFCVCSQTTAVLLMMRMRGIYTRDGRVMAGEVCAVRCALHYRTTQHA